MATLEARLVQQLDQMVASGLLPGYRLILSHPSLGRLSLASPRNTLQQVRQPDDNTRYAIYSVTKAVTALTALRLVASGDLAMFGLVKQYLPGWTDLAGQDVTVSHLLTHTAGFTYGSRDNTVAAAYRAGGFVRTAPDDLRGAARYAMFSKFPRLYTPGTAWSYSFASDVLGWIISEVCGCDLVEVMRNQVFEPLGMQRACMYTETPDTNTEIVQERYESGWRPAERAMQDWGRAQADQSGGAGLMMSTQDLHALASAFCLQDATFLPTNLWTETQTNHIPGGRDLTHGVSSPLQGRTLNGVGFSTSVAVTFDGEASGLPQSTGEIGWEGSTGCFFLANPNAKLSIAFVTHVYPHRGMPWWKAIRTLIYEELGCR